MRKEHILSLVCGINEKVKDDFVKRLTTEFSTLQKSGSNNNCDTKIKYDEIINLQSEIKFQPVPNLTDPSDQPKTTDILFNLIDTFKFLSQDFRSIVFLIDNPNQTLETNDIDEIRMIINIFGNQVTDHLIFVIFAGEKPDVKSDEYFKLEAEMCQNVLKQLKNKKIYVKEHQIILNWNRHVDSIKKITSLTYLNDKFDRNKNQPTLAHGSVASKVTQAINILLTHYDIKLEEVKELKQLYEKLADGVTERLFSLSKNFEVWTTIHHELGYLKDQIKSSQDIEKLLFKGPTEVIKEEPVIQKFPEGSKNDLAKIKIIKPPTFKKKSTKAAPEMQLAGVTKGVDELVDG